MPIPPELARACADIAPAGDADTIAGRQARYVAAPASTEEASALLRAAAALGLTVVPRGAGRLQHWGNPPDSCDLIVDTRRLDRIVVHVPADTAVTVQAGVRLRDLARAVEATGQSMAFLPPRRPAFAGTVGGLIATNASGPRRYRYGTSSDRLTAITVVRADGTIVRSADTARVAGQDLVTLFAGSYGSLGVITEATFRLEPLCKVSGATLLPCTGPEHAAELVEVAADPSLAASGIDVRWLSADEPLGLIVSFQSEDREDFEARRARLHALAGSPAPTPLDPARALRLDGPDHGGLPPAVAREMLARQEQIRAAVEDPPPDTGTLVRVAFPPARLAAALTVIRAAAASSGVDAAIGGSAGVGVLDVQVPAELPAAAVARFVAALRAGLGGLSQAGTAAGVPRAIVVYAPDEVRDLTDTHGPVPSLALLQAVKDEFDPEHRMAPGRLADAV
jgi:glycolate oxidase FAD binding subunit